MKQPTELRAPGVLIAALLAATPARAAVPGAAGEPWPTFRGDPQLTGVARGDLPQALDLLWTFQAGGGIESTAAVAGGGVYVASVDGSLYCLGLDTGSQRWKYAGGAPIKSSPSVFGDTVYVGDEAGVFHAVDARDGRLKWRFQTEAAVASSATMAGGRVIFGSNDSNLYALSPADGAVVWKIQTGGYVYGTPAVLAPGKGFEEPAVVSAGCDGILRVVRASDGRVLKQFKVGAYVGASPAVSGARVFVGTFENQVLGIDLRGPGLLWTYEHPERKFPFYSSAAIGEGILVVGGRDRMVHALDPATGKPIWTFEAGAKVDASPVLVKDRAFVATTGGQVIALKLATGEAAWKFETGSSIVGSPSVAAGRLLIGTTGGMLYTFGGK